MKILYITLENLSLHKGSVVHIKEIITGFRKLGHEVGLIACSWGKFEKADSFYNLHRFSGIKKQPYIISSFFLFIYLFKILSKYDVIYARDYHTVLIALIPRMIFNKRLVFEINGIASEEWRLRGNSFLNYLILRLIRKMEKLASKYSDSIVSVTSQISFYLKNQFNVYESKVNIISNGVNTGIFRPSEDVALLSGWREKLNIRKEDMIVTFIGNLAPWQGVESIIQVAPLILMRIKNLKFMIIGDGLVKEKLEKETIRLGISKHFIFTGMMSYENIPFYINISDICVTLKRRLKSGYSPLKLYEYMACGKPVIASRVEGLEFIESEGAGILIEPEDIDSLEKALEELLKDPQKRTKMGQKGLQIVKNKFGWDVVAIKVEKVLERLI